MKGHFLPTALLFLFLTACAGQTPATQPADTIRTDVASDLCLEAWTYAPGNFVLDVAGGADVFLMPDVQDFPLYCTPEKARQAMQARAASLPEANGGWALFRVEGLFHDIARPVGYDNYILKSQARLVDWAY